jgi:hypothetical protein
MSIACMHWSSKAAIDYDTAVVLQLKVMRIKKEIKADPVHWTSE